MDAQQGTWAHCAKTTVDGALCKAFRVSLTEDGMVALVIDKWAAFKSGDGNRQRLRDVRVGAELDTDYGKPFLGPLLHGIGVEGRLETTLGVGAQRQARGKDDNNARPMAAATEGRLELDAGAKLLKGSVGQANWALRLGLGIVLYSHGHASEASEGK